MSDPKLSAASNDAGVSAVMLIMYGAGILFSVSLAVGMIVSGLCDERVIILVYSASVLLLQTVLPCAMSHTLPYVVAVVVGCGCGAVICGVGVGVLGFHMRSRCGDLPVSGVCDDITKSFSAYTWALIWCGLLGVVFLGLVMCACVRWYYIISDARVHRRIVPMGMDSKYVTMNKFAL